MPEHYFHKIGNMETKAAVAALEALAQESRLAVFRLLVTAGPEGLSAGRIAERVGLPNATLSFHLAQLRNAGLVTCRRKGRSLFYAADFAKMAELLGFLTENCCQGRVAHCVPITVTPRTRVKEKVK